MHHRSRLFAVIAIALAAAVGCGRGDRPPPPSGEPPRGPADDARLTGWRDDLAFLGRELPARHVAPWAHRPEADWRADLAALTDDLPGLTDDQIVVRMAQLVASLGDGHTRLIVPAETWYPVQTFWFDDGLFVMAAPGGERWANGKQVVAIGGRPTADALALLATVAPHDNQSQLRAEAAVALRDPRMVRGLGLAGADGALTLTLAVDGATRPLTLTAGTARTAWGAPITLTTMALKKPYWSQVLADRDALFVQYNACVDAQPPWADFVAELGRTLDEQALGRLVIDLRFNGGGDSRLFAPLIQLIAAHPEVRVFGLIGRGTFSSAVLDALDLEQAGATLVGEVAGGAPTHHGYPETFTLPGHSLAFSASRRYFPNLRHPGAELVPALPVPRTAADFFAGKDAALDAALAAP